jgi:hypothetical protein
LDINFDKEKILSVYSEISYHNLYRKAKTSDKILFFILPIAMLAITCIFCIFCIYKNIFHKNRACQIFCVNNNLS